MEACIEYSSISQCLEKEGMIATTIRGYSMYPMLKSGRDCVVCRRYTGNARKYDVLLYVSNGKLVLHRVISNKRNDGRLVIRGDNCFNKEYVPEESVMGILTDFTRKNRDYTVDSGGYRLYSVLIVLFSPLVRLKILVKSFLSRLKRKISGKR